MDAPMWDRGILRIDQRDAWSPSVREFACLLSAALADGEIQISHGQLDHWSFYRDRLEQVSLCARTGLAYITHIKPNLDGPSDAEWATKSMVYMTLGIAALDKPKETP